MQKQLWVPVFLSQTRCRISSYETSDTEICAILSAVCVQWPGESEVTYCKVRENIVILNKCVDDMLGRDKPPATPNEWVNVIDPMLPKRREKVESKKATSRKCSMCKEIGHTKPRCPLNGQVISTPTFVEGSSSATREDLCSMNSSMAVSAKSDLKSQKLIDYCLLWLLNYCRHVIEFGPTFHIGRAHGYAIAAVHDPGHQLLNFSLF